MPKKRVSHRKTVKKQAVKIKRNHVLIAILTVVSILFIVTAVRGYWTTLLSSQPVNDIYGKALSINDNGDVLIVGAVSPFDRPHPVIWNGTIQSEVTDGLTDMYNVPTSPNVFNNNREFVGTDTVGGTNQAFLWNPAKGVKFLGLQIAPNVMATMTQAFAVNNKTQVAGIFTSNADNCSHIFIWQADKWQVVDNPNLLCNVMPTDINDNGVITGYTTSENTWKAFILDPSTNAYTEIVSPNYKNIYPWSINNNNSVVGYAVDLQDPMTNAKAFLWSGSTYTYLGTLGGTRSIAYAINDNGIIAGESNIKNDSSEFHAFVIQKNVMVDLGVLDAGLGVITQGTDALSINTTGIIVGTNYTFNPTITPNPATGETNYFQTPVTWDYVLTKIKKPKNIRNPHNTPTPTPIGG